jgi:two-component system, OmpR family, alkaline phosphatase synthesis response regulator PhoP
VSAKNIYVIEDENDIADLIKYNLELHGYKVSTFSNGEKGLSAVEHQKPDLMILDIMLPGMSGLEICKIIKGAEKTRAIPIIMASAKGSEDDIVKGLELGADDYMTKPFSTTVLKARVEAVLRRQGRKSLEEATKISYSGIEIDVARVEAAIDGAKVELTQSEFKILHFLLQKPGWVFTRNQIVEAIRGENYAVTERTIDFQMVGLRKKMGPKGDLIETVRGVGYRFKEKE